MAKRRPRAGQVYIWNKHDRYLILGVRYTRGSACWDLYGFDKNKIYNGHTTTWPINNGIGRTVTFGDATDEEHVMFAKATLLGEVSEVDNG